MTENQNPFTIIQAAADFAAKRAAYQHYVAAEAEFSAYTYNHPERRALIQMMADHRQLMIEAAITLLDLLPVTPPMIWNTGKDKQAFIAMFSSGRMEYRAAVDLLLGWNVSDYTKVGE